MVSPGSVVLAVLLVTAPAFAADRTAPQQHPAHHHGAASLQVSLEGQMLQIAFDGPADNLLGFEHAPRNDAQKQTVARAEQQLKQPTQLFATPAAAGCQAQPPHVAKWRGGGTARSPPRSRTSTSVVCSRHFPG
jgi:hypothetical protein